MLGPLVDPIPSQMTVADQQGDSGAQGGMLPHGANPLLGTYDDRPCSAAGGAMCLPGGATARIRKTKERSTASKCRANRPGSDRMCGKGTALRGCTARGQAASP